MEKQQLEKFTNRAAGIAFASLILFFSLPLEKLADTKNLTQAAPHLIIFFFSMLMISVFWTAQTKIIGLITKMHLSSKIVWLSRFYFFFLVLMPLDCGWIAANFHWPGSVLLYSCNLLVISLLHLLLLCAALSFNYRHHQVLTVKVRSSLKKIACAGPVFYMVAILLSYINVYLSLVPITAGLGFYALLLNKKQVVGKI
ncbi:TMEM175 family protein [Mucilaginibacter sp.]|uniref:TMEM175 family protein n=1 Tax=Mucilaginibacter sp. TaxID=1882438 RepID=UPI003D0ECE82